MSVSVTNPWSGYEPLLEKWSALSLLLESQRHLWEPRPFMEPFVSWEEDWPEVSKWAKGLSGEAIDAMEANPFVLDNIPKAFSAWAQHVAEHVAIGTLPFTKLPHTGRRQLSWKVPQTKWKQVQAFCASLLSVWPQQGREIVDWCSGKGHLGRTLGAILNLPLLGLERQAPLCEVGVSMATRQQVEGRFIPTDVLADDAGPFLSEEQVAVGLHACGVLSHTLLRQAVEHNLLAVAVAPCCHHFVGNGVNEYQPLSQAGQKLAMSLDDRLLRLSIADEVKASPLERRKRRRELAFRLGFDELVREATGEDQYRSMGNLSLNVCELPFANFCIQMSESLELPLPPKWNPTRALQAGIQRSREARGRALVRSLFRRPMELWLVAERALFLAEHGWDTQVGVFCKPSLTPRNVMIIGRRKG